MQEPVNRRSLILAGGGLIAAVPALARPVGLMQMRHAVYALDGPVKNIESWRCDDRAMSPWVRLVFPNATSAWMKWDPKFFLAQSIRTRKENYGGPAQSLEVSIWAPNGMRAVSMIPLDIRQCI